MYEEEASDAELASFGLRRSDYAGTAYEIWPENWQAYSLFCALSTQWRVGMSGPSGLDHNVMFRRMDRMGLSDAEYDQLDLDIRVMEREALAAMREKK